MLRPSRTFRGRGGFRGHRTRFSLLRGSSWSRAAHGSGEEGPPSPPLGPLLKITDTVELLHLGNSDILRDESVEITGCTCAASFNWLQQDEPTIVVPGAPPAWTPLTDQPELRPDHGAFFRDINAAYFPAHPMEPTIRALLLEMPDLATQSVDIVACSKTMTNLLHFVLQRDLDRPFRFFVEVLGKTVFFVRRENSPKQTIEGMHGYGKAYPAANTTWGADVTKSVSHQRLMHYWLANLACVVRFEGDGYLEERLLTEDDAEAEPGSDQGNKQVSGEEPSRNTSAKSSGNEFQPASQGSAASLTVVQVGRKIPQAAMFDIKTRSIWNEQDVLAEELPRYWLGQIPNFILARHSRGHFETAELKDVTDAVEEWEQEHQTEIKRFHWLLRRIMALAKGQENGKLEVRCKNIGKLELRGQDTNEHETLPQKLKEKWLKNDLH